MSRHAGGFSKSTFLVTTGSFCADLATEMLTPILPIFLTRVLNANGSIVGLVDGIAQAVRNIIDGFSGWISDKLQQRKAIVLAGYAMSAMAKPIMGISTLWESVLAARILDRLGAGVRSRRETRSSRHLSTNFIGAAASGSKVWASTRAPSWARW